MRPIRRAGSIVLCVVIATQFLAPVRAAATTEPYRQPVDAPVVDRFRPPKTRYGPGNRGWEYATTPGQTVVAAGAGTVVFSGSVGRSQFVVVLHADGLRTTAGYLRTRAVAAGAHVRGGQIIGTAETGFHFTIRSGDVYLDPASFFEHASAATVTVRLVPASETLPPWFAGESRERRGVVESVLGTARAVGGQLGAGASALRGLFVDGLETVDRRLDALLVDLDAFADAVLALALDEAMFWIRLAEEIDELALYARDLYAAWQQPCTDDATTRSVVAPAHRRALVLVDGLASDSGESTVADIDMETLGYESTDVVRYSYAGGQTPRSDTGSPFADIESSPYRAADTYGDIVARGTALADLIEAAADAATGVPIDVVGHSLGGLVARQALVMLEARGQLDVLGQVATISSPHEGAALATLVRALGPISSEIVSIGSEPGGYPPPDALVVSQLAQQSAFIRDLRKRGVPDAVRFRTIGARGDPIVPGTEADVVGEPHVIVDTFDGGSHSTVVRDPRTTTELLLALNDLDPGCQGIMNHLADFTVGSLVHYGTLATSVAAKRYSR